MGTWGFILGSLIIGSSQLWKTFRIGSAGGKGFSFTSLFSEKDVSQKKERRRKGESREILCFLDASPDDASMQAFTAAGVELSAGLGAICFFIGTSLYEHGPIEGPGSMLDLVLQIWLAGSVLFTAGGLFLSWRHFIMGVV
jgi:hypothetical protein